MSYQATNLVVARWGAMTATLCLGALRGTPSQLLVLSLLALFSLSTQSLLNPRNIVVVYHYLLLGIGPIVLALSEPAPIWQLGSVSLVAFAIGSGFASIRGRGARTVSPDSSGSATARVGVPLLRTAATMQCVALLVTVASSGLGAYLSGLTLRDKIVTYAASGGLGPLDLLNLFAQVMTIACVATYLSVREERTKHHWLSLAVVLVLLPALRLDRSGLAVNLLGLLFAARGSFTVSLRGSRKVVAAVSFVAVLLAGLAIGSLRQSAIASDATKGGARVALLASELSPVLVVARAEDQLQGSFSSANAVNAAATRFVPRRVYVGKPQNTITQYMQQTDPAALAAGYSLAPTALGVLLLVLGKPGALLACLLAGYLLSRKHDLLQADRGVVFILLVNSYTLVRDDPSNSVPVLLLSLVMRRIFLAYVGPRAQSRASTYA